MGSEIRKLQRRDKRLDLKPKTTASPSVRSWFPLARFQRSWFYAFSLSYNLEMHIFMPIPISPIIQIVSVTN